MRFVTAIAALIAGVFCFSATASADVIPPRQLSTDVQRFLYRRHNAVGDVPHARRRRELHDLAQLQRLRRRHRQRQRAACNASLTTTTTTTTALPRGSYRDTCRDENVEGDTLKAECQDRNGRWRYTELQSFRSCRGDIANVNGMLRCRRDDDDDARLRFAGRQLARTVAATRASRDGRCAAECRDLGGYWRRTSIDLRQLRRRCVQPARAAGLRAGRR